MDGFSHYFWVFLPAIAIIVYLAFFSRKADRLYNSLRQGERKEADLRFEFIKKSEQEAASRQNEMIGLLKDIREMLKDRNP